LLLEWNAEERNASDFRAHDGEKVVNVCSLLNVIGQMEVRVVQFGLIR
jgi:hypothetical protein